MAEATRPDVAIFYGFVRNSIDSGAVKQFLKSGSRAGKIGI